MLLRHDDIIWTLRRLIKNQTKEKWFEVKKKKRVEIKTIKWNEIKGKDSSAMLLLLLSLLLLFSNGGEKQREPRVHTPL